MEDSRPYRSKSSIRPRRSRAPSSSIPTNNYLYYVLPHGEAIQYRIASGAEYMGWTGRAEVGAMKEWPTWMPTASIMERWPQFQVYKQHGPLEGRWDNPLGARALYLFQNNRGHAHPHPRHQRAVGNRGARVLGLHPHARHGRDRPLWPGARRHSGGGDQLASHRNGGSSKLLSLRECRVSSWLCNRPIAAMPICRCSAMARS